MNATRLKYWYSFSSASSIINARSLLRNRDTKSNICCNLRSSDNGPWPRRGRVLTAMSEVEPSDVRPDETVAEDGAGDPVKGPVVEDRTVEVADG